MFGIFRSTILTKIVMAVSGIIWVGFALGHLSGHFLLFAGQESYNAYSQGLKDLGPLLWLARIVLIISFLIHTFSGIMLISRNKEARPIGYKKKKPILSTPQSRMMALSGIILFTFMVYHLAHYTFRIGLPNLSYIMKDGREVYDVYTMVVDSFHNVFIAVVYVIFMMFLGLHLSHAISSIFQTLGLNHPNYNKLIQKLGPALAALITIGYIAIPVSVMLGIIHNAGGH